MGDQDISRRQLMLMAVATEGGLAAAAVAVGYLFGQPPLAGLRWDPAAPGRGLLLTLPLLALFWACVRWPVGPLRDIKQFVDEIVKPLFAPLSVAELAVIALLAGVGEEMLFRGVLQPLFIRWVDFWPGLLAASLLFGLAHAVTVGYVALAAAIGVYLGWFAHRFDNLLEVIVAHAVYDFVALLYLVKWTPREQR